MRFPQLLTPAEKRLAVLLFVLTLVGSGLRMGRRISPDVDRWLAAGGDSDPFAARDTTWSDSIRVHADVPSEPPASPAPPTGASGPNLVDPNTADKPMLVTLPGIGPALADRIMEDRSMNGPYRTAEDLLRVRGIGRATLESMRSRLAF